MVLLSDNHIGYRQRYERNEYHSNTEQDSLRSRNFSDIAIRLCQCRFTGYLTAVHFYLQGTDAPALGINSV